MFMVRIWRNKYAIIMQSNNKKKNYLTTNPMLNTSNNIVLVRNIANRMVLQKDTYETFMFRTFPVEFSSLIICDH